MVNVFICICSYNCTHPLSKLIKAQEINTQQSDGLYIKDNTLNQMADILIIECKLIIFLVVYSLSSLNLQN